MVLVSSTKRYRTNNTKEVKRRMEDSTIKAIAAMFCITVLEAIALLSGINGLMLVSAIGALAGVAGYEIKAIRDRL